jgi:hypothetical protein
MGDARSGALLRSGEAFALERRGLFACNPPPEHGTLSPVPTAVDPETYLRIAGERAVIDGASAEPWPSELLDAADALAAVGRIDHDVARSIVEDYELALGLRGHTRAGFLLTVGKASPPAQPLVVLPPRVVASEATVRMPWGTLKIHYIALAEDETRVAITARGDSGQQPIMMQAPLHAPLNVLDDRGRSHTAHFSGGGGNEWRGLLTSHDALPTDTAWIEIAGTRLDLPSSDNSGSTVEAESLPEASPAEQYLRLRLATGRPHSFSGIRAAIRALIACGALGSDSEIVAEARTIAEAFQAPGGAPGPSRHPWASLIQARARGGGPLGTVALGVATPAIDGIAICIDGMISSAEGFQLSVETRPGIDLDGPVGRIGGTRLAWWAEDDLGNQYLGDPSSWGGGLGADKSCGLIDFTPPLSPTASILRLMPTGLTERAVITVPLPWSRR